MHTIKTKQCEEFKLKSEYTFSWDANVELSLSLESYEKS